MRPIDADELIKFKVTGEIGNLSGDFIPGFAIENAPTIEAEPVRYGIPVAHYKTWFNSDGEPVTTLPYGYECPFCGDTDIKKFCPNCGAKMDGGSK